MLEFSDGEITYLLMITKRAFENKQAESDDRYMGYKRVACGITVFEEIDYYGNIYYKVVKERTRRSKLVQTLNTNGE